MSSSSESNPYTSPADSEGISSTRLRWPLIPAVLCWLLGTAVVLGFLTLWLHFSLNYRAGFITYTHIGHLVVGIVSGILWIIAGVMFTRCFWRTASITVWIAIVLGFIGYSIWLKITGENLNRHKDVSLCAVGRCDRGALAADNC